MWVLRTCVHVCVSVYMWMLRACVHVCIARLKSEVPMLSDIVSMHINCHHKTPKSSNVDPNGYSSQVEPD